MWDLVIKKLQWDGQGKVLDVGTGGGALAVEIAKRYPESEVWGIDHWGKGWNFSKQLCEKNAQHEGVEKRIVFQRASASNLPFEDNNSMLSKSILKQTSYPREILLHAIIIFVTENLNSSGSSD